MEMQRQIVSNFFPPECYVSYLFLFVLPFLLLHPNWLSELENQKAEPRRTDVITS